MNIALVEAQINLHAYGTNVNPYPTFNANVSLGGTLPTISCQQEAVLPEDIGSFNQLVVTNTSGSAKTIYLSVDRGNAYEAGVQTINGVCFGSGRDFEIEEKKFTLESGDSIVIHICVFEDNLPETDEVAFIKAEELVSGSMVSVGNQFKIIIRDKNRKGLFSIDSLSHYLPTGSGVNDILPNITPYSYNQLNDLFKFLRKPIIPRGSVIVFPEGEYYMSAHSDSADNFKFIRPNITYEAKFYDNEDVNYVESEDQQIGYNTVIHRAHMPDSIKYYWKFYETDTITHAGYFKRAIVYSNIFQTYGNDSSAHDNSWFIIKGLSFDGDFELHNYKYLQAIYDTIETEFPYLVPGIDRLEACNLVKLVYDGLNAVDSSLRYNTFFENCSFYDNVAAAYESGDGFTDLFYKSHVNTCRKGLVQVSSFNTMKLVDCQTKITEDTAKYSFYYLHWFKHYKTSIYCGLWQELNPGNKGSSLYAESSKFMDGSFTLNIQKQNVNDRINNCIIDDRGHSSGISFIGNSMSGGENSSMILVTNSKIIETNKCTVMPSYGKNQVPGHSKIYQYGGITFENVHFELNRYLINISDSTQDILNKNHLLEQCLYVTNENCTKNALLKFQNCLFTLNDSTHDLMDPLNPTYSTAIYVFSGLADSTNKIIMDHCEIDGFDNCFALETAKYNNKGTNNINDCIESYELGMTRSEINEFEAVGPNSLHTGNIINVSYSDFINCNTLILDYNNNTMTFNKCHFGEFKFRLNLDLLFNNTGAMTTPIPQFTFTNCTGIYNRNNQFKTFVFTHYNAGVTYIPSILTNFVHSNTLIYGNDVDGVPSDGFPFEKYLSYNATTHNFRIDTLYSLGYHYKPSSTSLIHHVSPPFLVQLKSRHFV